MTNKEKIITNYIEGYNQFDVEKMVLDFDENIVFENISNGEINMSLSGIVAFKEQAEQTKAYFTVRKQTITSFEQSEDEVEIDIDYYAVLAMDFPNGLKKDDELKLKGRSIFKFLNNKIIKITDIS